MTDSTRPTVLVSNRLPVSLQWADGAPALAPSSGGLATALASTHANPRSRWIGWAGSVHEATPEQRAAVSHELARLRLSGVSAPDAEYAGYYEGFSNGVLWPLLHYLVDKVQLDAEASWEAYRAVNDRFAAAVAAEAALGADVWIHDYHLMLVPSALRALRPDLRIGFFLHVPFPAHETFRILPRRAELLRGLLGADLIGFHTQSYQHHFAASCAYVLGIMLDHDVVEWEGRPVKLGTFPIGIDVERWVEGAATAGARGRAEEIARDAHGRRIILGVDRLDYTKGIPRRLLAIERFLEQHPAMRGRVQFIQVAVPTREGVDAYAAYRRSVNELVGRINGAFGAPGWVPIHLLHQSVSFEELSALYRAADVMLVTPLRDGMNLVAKEYCAAQRGAAGVLILSEFAGASDELSDALRVNPYDLGSVAGALRAALDMPEEERATRMGRLYEAVAAQPASRWAATFVDALSAGPRQPARPHVPPPAVAASRPTRWLLDYDGTLVGFSDHPEHAVADAALRSLLAALAGLPGARVDVISGRPRGWLEAQLGALPVGLHAEHGAWSRAAGERRWVEAQHADPGWKRVVREVLHDLVGGVAGAQVEEKESAVAWHYRRVIPELVAEHLGELQARLDVVAQRFDLVVLNGAKVLELHPRGTHKGTVVRRLLADLDGEAAVIIGDDATDEDMFVAAPDAAVTIKVGPGPSAARYRLPDPEAVRAFLHREVASARRAG